MRLLFLGRLEDVAGASRRDVDTGSLDSVLSALDPDLARALRGDRIRIAVNGELVADRSNLILADGDEIAFLPPVSGG